MKWLFALLVFAGCDNGYDVKFNSISIWEHHYEVGVGSDYLDSAATIDFIQKKIDSMPAKYDSVYVTKLPFDSRSIYSVVPLDSQRIFFIFHFYRLKTAQSPSVVFLNYDNYGDSVEYYLSSLLMSGYSGYHD